MTTTLGIAHHPPERLFNFSPTITPSYTQTKRKHTYILNIPYVHSLLIKLSDCQSTISSDTCNARVSPHSDIIYPASHLADVYATASPSPLFHSAIVTHTHTHSYRRPIRSGGLHLSIASYISIGHDHLITAESDTIT